MKILIIGRNSYIGNSLQKYLKRPVERSDWTVDLVSGASGEWQKTDFSEYDALVMCSALVHKKEKKLGWRAYDQANTQLPAAVFEKAKAEGVRQFVFLSSLAVYGRSSEVIDSNCQPDPDTFYGITKLAAERILLADNGSVIKVAILRPPLVYGTKAKGSYHSLCRIVRYFPFFPKIANQKSVVSIDRLCALIEEIIIERKSGIFHPQDKDYLSTAELAQKAGQEVGRRVWLVPFIPYINGTLVKHSRLWKKAFGSIVVAKELE